MVEEHSPRTQLLLRPSPLFRQPFRYRSNFAIVIVESLPKRALPAAKRAYFAPRQNRGIALRA